MAIVLVLRERLRRANHLILMREGWENWLFWYTLIQDCLTLCTCFFRSTCVCTCFFFLKSHIPLLKKRLPFSGTSYWKSFFLCSYAKRKSWGESGVFCTQSSSLLAIWFRCTVLSFYSACQIFFQVRFINVLSYICYMPNSVARIVLLGVSIFFMH